MPQGDRSPSRLDRPPATNIGSTNRSEYGSRTSPGRLIGIRPEETGVGSLKLEIGFIEELGALRLHHGTFAGQEFIIQKPSEPDAARPAQLNFGIEAARVHLFDAESGQRIELQERMVAAAA